MNLTQLQYFCAVCAHQSVSAAAESLFISQPSVSSAIKELEKEFGVALFRRHHRGVEVTEEGAEFLKHAEMLLRHAGQVRRTMEDIGSRKKVLRLGIPPMIGSLVLADIYRDFVLQNPDVLPDITEGGRRELMQLLEEDLLDMVLLPHRKPFEKSVAAFEVARLEIVCGVPKDNPLAKENALVPQMLMDTPVVLFKDSFFQTAEIKKWFSDAGIEPNVILQTDQLSTLQGLIAHRIAIGFMFRELLFDDSAIVPVALHTPMQICVSLVWKNKGNMRGGMQAFLSYMQKSNPFLKVQA